MDTITTAVSNALHLTGWLVSEQVANEIIAELGEQGLVIVPAPLPFPAKERDRIIEALVSVNDFFPGDVDECADVLMPMFAEAWDDGHNAGESDSEHGWLDPTPNPFVGTEPEATATPFETVNAPLSECGWFGWDQFHRPWWAREDCSGRMTDSPAGLLCETHFNARPWS